MLSIPDNPLKGAVEPADERLSEYACVRVFPALDNLEALHARYIRQSFTRHSHERLAVGVIESGAMEFYYRGENVVAAAGNINLCIPGEVHTGHAAVQSGWGYRMFYFTPAFVEKITTEIASAPHPFPFFQSGVLHDETLANQIRSLHAALEEPSLPRLEQESRLMDILAQMIIRHAQTPPALPRRGREPQAVTNVINYLQSAYTSDVSLNDLSRVSNLSRFHLVRVFRRALGVPPYEYLRQVRLERAKEMLGRGSSIAEAAARCGFVDQSHLTRWFKRTWGYTPGQYSNSVQYSNP